LQCLQERYGFQGCCHRGSRMGKSFPSAISLNLLHKTWNTATAAIESLPQSVTRQAPRHPHGHSSLQHPNLALARQPTRFPPPGPPPQRPWSCTLRAPVFALAREEGNGRSQGQKERHNDRLHQPQPIREIDQMCRTAPPVCADNHLSRFKGWPARPRSGPPGIDLDRAATGLYRARRDIVVEKIATH
jgi:hypothetical protein